MKILTNIENLFQKRKIIFPILFFLVVFQLIYSFLFPSYEDSWYWKTVEDLDFYQGYTFDTFDKDILQKVYPLIANYHMNLDAGGYLLLAHDFPNHYFKGNYTMLTRPLYPILVNWIGRPLHLISDSYSMTFAAGIIVNFILFFFTVFLFYLLVKKLISQRTAFLSSMLLIFSPMAHIWLIQPETNIFGVFAVIFSLYLLYNYFNNPSFSKLLIFSLVIGMLLLGKKIFAISIFIILLALFFRRFKEGFIFFFIHLLPLIFWSFWITKVWGLEFYVDEVSQFGFGVWLLNIFHWPWYQTLKIFIESVPNFISAVIYGFLLIPVIFALIGYRRFVLPKKNIIIFSFIISFFILFFGTNMYCPRWGFWLFPVIYPLAVLGVDEAADFLRRYKKCYALIFYILIYFLIILISSLNIYKFIYYN